MSENTTKYEVLYIIRPDMEEASKKALVEQLMNLKTGQNVVLRTKSTITKRVSTT